MQRVAVADDLPVAHAGFAHFVLERGDLVRWRQRIFGAVHVGLALGLLQFVSTLAITAGYLRFARRRLDPQVAIIRTRAGAANK